MKQNSDWITPSAIGRFTFCEKAWDMERCGQAVPTTKQMKQGTRKHRQKDFAVGVSSFLFAVALLLGLTFMAFFFVR